MAIKFRHALVAGFTSVALAASATPAAHADENIAASTESGWLCGLAAGSSTVFNHPDYLIKDPVSASSWLFFAPLLSSLDTRPEETRCAD